MIPHNRPTLNKEEEQAALRVIRSGWLAQGIEVKEFENEFCQFVGLPEGHAVAVSSGTAGIYLSLWVLGARGKRVAFPVYVCSALRHAVAMVEATEDLLDVAPDSPNLDLSSLAHHNPDIIIAPHLYGLPIDLGELGDLPVIEDCAQALGARVDGKSVGLQGRIGVFSFYATKLITSGGQGGMVASRHRDLVEAVRDYREFDCRRDDRRRFNFQMTDLQAGIGRAQLAKLPEFLERRADIFERYRRGGLNLMDVAQTAQHLSPVRYRAVLKSPQAPAIIERLAAQRIYAIVPIADWELLGPPEQFPNATRLTRETVSLPLYPSLSDPDINYIIASLRSSPWF